MFSTEYAAYFEKSKYKLDYDFTGHFVTIDAGFITFARKSKHVIGVVCDYARNVSYAYEQHWKGRYEKNSSVETDEYDPSLEYIPRSKRNEWSMVGLLGQMYVKDDGTCYAGKKCDCGESGIATKGDTWYVLERIDRNTIKILFK